MLLTLLLLTPLFYYLPKFALAAIVINSVIPLVAYQEARRLFNVKKTDFLLWLTAFLGTLFLGVLLGIAIAVGLSLVIVISESVRPQIVVLWRIPGTSIYRNMKQETNGAFVPNVFIVRIGSSLYFANASFVKDTLITYVNDLKDVNPIEYLVLEMTAVVSIDSTAAHVIHDIVTEFSERGIKVAFAMVGKRVEATMDRAKLREEIGEHWFFHTVDEAVQYCVQRQHAVRQHKMEEGTRPDETEMNNVPKMASIGNEIGISNDLNHAATTVFISFLVDVPNATGRIVACLERCGVAMVRAQVDALGDAGTKHSYWVRKMKTNKKLNADEIEALRSNLLELMSSVHGTSVHGTSEQKTIALASV
jgi:anti-anti-sigma regulatory factor